MKLKPLVGIVLSISLLFTFCGQTAFASTFGAVQDYAQKYIAHGQSSNMPTISTPTANVSSGTYKSSLVVKLSGTYRKPATLYYTLDGTTPTASSYVYNKPITLTASCNLKVFAVDSSGNTSGVLSNTYTILTPPSKPSSSVSGGTYNAAQNVRLTDDTQGASIYYTLDGTAPSAESILYAAPLDISQSRTLQAVAVDNNGMMSEIQSVSYTISSAVTTVSDPAPSSDPSPASSPASSAEPSASPSPAASPEPSPSASPSPTPSSAASPTPSPLPSPSATPLPSPSATPSPSPSATPSPTTAPSPSPSAMPSSPPISPSALSTWVAYWDWQSGLNEVNAMPQKPGSIELFGACFNSDDKLFYPDEMQSLPEAAKAVQSANPGMQVYLTVVNDSLDANGKWIDKDSGMLDRIMKSDASRTSNINDILNMVSQGNYNGVEIDYEEFSDTAWKGFTVFCSQLYDALKAKGLGMRVCLESYAPFSEGSLPAGPEYTIMAYSLHWEDSDPGPRADYELIKKVAQELDALPGDKRMAFAAGGYDWANGSGKEVTEAEAAKLVPKSTNVQRDSQSGALHFTYKSNGTTHTVWYSDEQTLKSWINQANSSGIGNVAVWKMGGNMPETLQMLGGSR